MPRYKGSCGCYNREDARRYGLAVAVVWNDILDRAEHFDANPMWYDQQQASDRLGIPRQTVNRAVKVLQVEGRIKAKVGYRPNSRVTTTWIEILVEETEMDGKWLDELVEESKQLGDILDAQNEHPKDAQNEHPILKETKKTDLSLNGCHEVKADKEKMKPTVLYQRVKSIFRQRKDVDKKTCLEGIESLQERLDDETILELAAYCASDKYKPLEREDGSTWKPTFFWFTDPTKTEAVINVLKNTPKLTEEKRGLKW